MERKRNGEPMTQTEVHQVDNVDIGKLSTMAKNLKLAWEEANNKRVKFETKPQNDMYATYGTILIFRKHLYLHVNIYYHD